MTAIAPVFESISGKGGLHALRACVYRQRWQTMVAFIKKKNFSEKVDRFQNNEVIGEKLKSYI